MAFKRSYSCPKNGHQGLQAWQLVTTGLVKIALAPEPYPEALERERACRDRRKLYINHHSFLWSCIINFWLAFAIHPKEKQRICSSNRYPHSFQVWMEHWNRIQWIGLRQKLEEIIVIPMVFLGRSGRCSLKHPSADKFFKHWPGSSV